MVKAHLQLSEKMRLVFQAMDKVVDEMQDVPEHLKTKRLDEGKLFLSLVTFIQNIFIVR